MACPTSRQDSEARVSLYSANSKPLAARVESCSQEPLLAMQSVANRGPEAKCQVELAATVECRSRSPVERGQGNPG
jgi:hypothetical protein